MVEGLLDTNVFIHAHSRDSHAEECRGFLRALSEGRARAVLDTIAVHELSYVLPSFVKSMSRRDVAQYLVSVIAWDGIIADKDLLLEAIRLWSTQEVGFADAYLAARALRENRPVYTRNFADLERCGATVPPRLPS